MDTETFYQIRIRYFNLFIAKLCFDSQLPLQIFNDDNDKSFFDSRHCYFDEFFFIWLELISLTLIGDKHISSREENIVYTDFHFEDPEESNYREFDDLHKRLTEDAEVDSNGEEYYIYIQKNNCSPLPFKEIGSCEILYSFNHNYIGWVFIYEPDEEYEIIQSGTPFISLINDVAALRKFQLTMEDINNEMAS